MTPLSRRRVLLAGSLALLTPSRLWAQSAADLEHRATIEVPILAEDPVAVPVQVWVDHPMEPDHFVRSLEITLPRDPVPYKGTWRFTPACGRAWAAFQMRSGAGGQLRAVAECSRHGRFTATREVRVAEGGCTGAEPADRGRIGNPVLRLPRSIRAGQVIEVRTKVDHNSTTGLGLRQGKIVREGPEFYLKQMVVFVDADRVAEFRMSPAISPNPLIRFAVRVTRSATLRVEFVNNEGRRWEVSQPVRV